VRQLTDAYTLSILKDASFSTCLLIFKFDDIPALNEPLYSISSTMDFAIFCGLLFINGIDCIMAYIIAFYFGFVDFPTPPCTAI